ncbi:TIGR01777 family oxidoreductase [Gemmatimonadota bacterium]
MPYFRRRTHLPYPPQEVFAWHLRPGALQRLIPPWHRVRILEQEGGIAEGGRLLLGLQQGPAEVKWEVEHTAFEDGVLFRDEQISGPLDEWIHSHRFIPADDGGCIMEDDVEWAAPLGAAGRLFTEPFIEKELERVFGFRHARLRNDLELHHRYNGPPLTVAITGSTGLIGTNLSHFLRSGGHHVIPVVRGKGGEGRIIWDPESDTLDPTALEGVDAVVHLAGESLSALRWTEEKKKRILESRTRGTALLARTLAKMAKPPTVLVSASAVGFYGHRGNDPVSEGSGSGSGFLAKVCGEWEKATGPARKAGLRVVRLRTGFVISPAGPGLGKMLPPFKAGLGGRIGSGRQYMSWVDLDDVVGLIHHALTRPGVSGPLNVTAPQPVPNSTFTDALGRVLGRPTLVPLPSLAVKAMLGELGSELLLKGARVMPAKAQETGYEFLYSSLEESLRYQLGRGEKKGLIQVRSSPSGEREG